MKYQKLMALLGLTQLMLHSNFFGTKQPFAKLEEEQLQKIEDAIETSDTSALEEQITNLEAEKQTLEEQKTALEADINALTTAVNDGLNANGLTLAEEKGLAEAIAMISNAKVNATHEIPPVNGEEKPTDGLENGFFDPKAAHNQI